MTINWSLALNVVLLMSVIVVLVRSLRGKKEEILPIDNRSKPYIRLEEKTPDDIIAIRKVAIPEEAHPVEMTSQQDTEETLMLFLLAKQNRQLAGYEMLQSILAAGLRFGEGHIFHRYQFTNSQGPVICSLAAATPTGTFDLQNIGAFQAKGLCLFMHLSGQSGVDTERLEKMLEIAHQLAEGLDTYLLDDKRQVFTDETKQRYLHFIESTSLQEAL